MACTSHGSRLLLLLLLPTLATALAAYNNSKLSEHHARPQSTACSGRSSNEAMTRRQTDSERSASKSVLPLQSTWPGASAFVQWVHNYSRSIHRNNSDPQKLHELHALSQHPVGAWHDQGGTSYYATISYWGYIQAKCHVLYALETQMQLSELLQPGRSLLEVGAGPGWMAAYLMAQHGLDVVAYDVPFTSECTAFLHSPFAVQFFWESLPVETLFFYAVSFVSMLHHAASITPVLLKQAAIIARRWVLVIEDSDVGSNRAGLQKHNGNGIFRTDAEWLAMFAVHCLHFPSGGRAA